MFHFQLVITEKCNLKCEYCYMKQKSHNMTKEIFDLHYSYLPEIMKVYNEGRFVTTFFGGEPLLNWELIEYILPIVSKDLKCDQIVLPTNGLLLDRQKVDVLRHGNVNISLSFDGLWHNQKAYPKHHTKKLWKELNLTPKVMIAPNRGQTIKGNYMWFVESFGTPNPDFTLVRDGSWLNAGFRESDRFKKEIKDMAEQVVKYNKEGIPTLPGPFSLYILDTLVGKKYGKRPFGCFAGHSGGGFMPDGLVYPCARFGTTKSIPLFDSIEKRETDRDLRIGLKITQNPQKFSRCQKCDLYEYCNAGCLHAELGDIYALIPEPEWECDARPEICKLIKECYKLSFWIVDELKDNEGFQKLLKNMMRSIENV